MNYIHTYIYTRVYTHTYTHSGFSQKGPWGNCLSPRRLCAVPHAQVCMRHRKTNHTNSMLLAEIWAHQWRHTTLFPSGYYNRHQNDSVWKHTGPFLASNCIFRLIISNKRKYDKYVQLSWLLMNTKWLASGDDILNEEMFS